MRKDTIYLGNNPVNEKELCGLIIGHLSKNNETVKNNMLKYIFFIGYKLMPHSAKLFSMFFRRRLRRNPAPGTAA